MTEDLKKELKKLLLTYPELNGSNLNFNADDVVLTKQGGEGEKEAAVEQRKGPWFAEAIRGNSPKVEIRKSPLHGYGVFAKQTVEKGELLDESRLLKLGYRQHYLTDPVLKDYIWGDPEDKIETEKHGNVVYVALGFGSIFNHQDKPNSVQELDYDTQIMTVHAGRTIDEGEEIFITYGSRYFLIRDFWKNIKQNRGLENVLQAKKASKEAGV